MNDVPRHPEAHVMAAFVDGTLAPAEIAAVAGHLRDCADCRTVVSETARFEREEEAVRRPRSSTWWWLAAAAAVIVAMVIAAPLLRPRTPIGTLIAASPREHRTVEARLSGFPWARLAAPARGEAPPDPADLKLIGAAGKVLDGTKDNHARGVAYLVIDRRPDAIAALEKAAETSTDPRAWNDLAAARFAVAVRDEHPSQLPEALADVDHALRLDPKLTEALFNRALILEHLAMREQARLAWQQYLDIDPAGAWSTEAREHLRALQGHARKFDPKLLEQAEPAAVAKDFPRETRERGEGLLLCEWAAAEQAHDVAAATTKLARVRDLGKALAAFNDEHLLEDAVAAIDRANVIGRAQLAEAHLCYCLGRAANNKRHAAEAQQQLHRSADLFAGAGSPMAAVASYFEAGTFFDQGRRGDARDDLLRLRARIDRKRDRALDAQIGRTLAVNANGTGDLVAAAREADASATLFRALGEQANAAFVDGIAAHALELMGEWDQAWTRRIRAIDFACRETDHEGCNSLLQDSGNALAWVDRPAAAFALIGATIDDGQPREPFAGTIQLVKRARIAARANVAEDARLSIARAYGLIGRIGDPALRKSAEVQVTIEDAALRVPSESRRAVADLDRCVAFLTAHDITFLLPYAYLQRARAHRALGDAVSAAADYESALTEIEKERDRIGGADVRLAFLDTASQVIDDAVSLHLSRGDVAQAFDVSDRRHLAVHPAEPPSSSIVRRVPPGVAVVEYDLLPQSIAIFCVSRQGIAAKQLTVDRRDLASRIDTLNSLVRSRAPIDDIHRASAALFSLLIAPVRERLAGIDELIFVPDRQLYAVPFNALYNEQSGHFLIEDFIVHFANAASSPEPAAPSGWTPALVVADPATSLHPRLAQSREEAEQVAALYGATLLSGDTATRAQFVKNVEQSGLIHFAGHAESGSNAAFGVLLFAGDQDGALTESDIAHLHLARQPLVVLAACGTFRGDAMHVAGMPSLARAFLIAGARGVVGTLWEVDDDDASQIFLRLHQNLRAADSPAKALRNAQLAMLHSSDPRLRHPATWAPLEILSNSI
jgi:CHAT domain-containing protein